MQRGSSNNIAALLLMLPILVYLAGYYFNHGPGLEATGFLMHDNVGYLAYAKQYLDSNSFQLFYSNPFNESGSYPHIYFQPHTILIAALLALKIPAGFIMISFMLICSFLFFRVMIRLHDFLLPIPTKRWLTLTVFAWGGGLLALTGVLGAVVKPQPGLDFLENIFIVDPGWGWWGLNLGRSLFIGCEAFYHLLFFLIILLVLKRKWLMAFLVCILLSASHPFTGIELLSILSVWMVLEKLLFRNKEIPWWFVSVIIALTACHAIYYLIYLNQFPDHRSVSEQYSLNWRLRYFSIIPAYSLVGILAVASIYMAGMKKYFTQVHNRLFACWFIIAFLLSNHELFMEPMQPLHFTRGYIWSGLFLMGLPALNRIIGIKKTAAQKFLASSFIILFLSDNFLWIINDVRFTRNKASETHITLEQKKILKLLEDHSDNSTLIIGKDLLPYMSAVYTSAYPWISHPFTTPHYTEKKNQLNSYLESGTVPEEWRNRKLIIIFRAGEKVEQQRALMPGLQLMEIYRSSNYHIFKSE